MSDSNSARADPSAADGGGSGSDAVRRLKESAAIPKGVSSTGAGAGKLAAQPSIGKIGRFELKAVLGRGGFGIVYRAYDPLLDRQIALKVPMHEQDSKKEERFLREAKAAARLRHPNIVAVFESGRAGERLYIASEYVAGKPMHVAVDDEKPSRQAAVGWVRDMAEALAYAHSEGIVHRDVKPANALIDKAGRPQILDFGLAKRIDDDSAMTVEGSVLGTPSYMSPEQARGKAVGPAADQYSLGVVLYELLTGQKPFAGPMEVVIAQHLKEEPPPLRTINPSIPRDLESICLKSLEKNPSDRYSSCAAFAADLNAWLRGEATVVRPPTRAERLHRWVKREPVVAGALAVVVAVTTMAFVSIARSLRLANIQKGIALEQRQFADAARSEAESQRAVAERNAAAERVARKDADRLLYTTRMSLAERAWTENRIGRCRELLAELSPRSAGDEDLRDWEWRFLDRQCRQDLGEFAVPARLYSFSPDGKYLATCRNPDERRQIYLYRAADLSAPFAALHGHSDEVTAATFSPDGGRLATTSRDRTLRYWDVNAQRELWRLPNVGHPGDANRISFSADGKRLAMGGLTGIVLVDLADAPRPIPKVGKGGILTRGAAITEDGAIACSGDDRGVVRLWNPTTGDEIARLHRGDKAADVCLQPGTHKFFVKFGYAFALIDGDARKMLWKKDLGSQDGWGKSAWWPCRELFLFGNEDGTVSAVDPKNGAVVREFKGPQHAINAIEVTPGGERFIAYWNRSGGRVFDTSSTRAVVKSRSRFNDIRVGYAPTGIFAAAKPLTGGGRSAELVRADGFVKLREIGPPKGTINGMAFTVDGRRIATAWQDGHVRVYNVADGALVSDCVAQSGKDRAGNPLGISVVQFDPLGNLVAAVAANWQLTVHDPSTGKFVGRFPAQDLSAVCFSPDGRRVLAQNAGRRIKAWDLATGTEAADYPAGERTRALTYSPDGKHLLIGDQVGTVTLLDAATGRQVRQFTAHGGQIFCACYSRSGQRIVTCGNDGRVKLWDVATGQEVIGFAGSEATLLADGEQMLTFDRGHFYRRDPRPLTEDLRLRLRADDLIEYLGGDSVDAAELIRRIARSRTSEEVRTLASQLAPRYAKSP